MSHTSVAGLILACLFSSGCVVQESRSQSVQRRDSAGIVIVSNPGSDRPLNWMLREQFVLGSATSGPDQFYQVDENSVTFDSRSRLYVLDRGNMRILAFSRSGDHLRTFGSEGKGPGQLSYPMGIWTDEDEIRVLDRAKGAIVRYEFDGTPLEDLGMRTFGFGRRVRPSHGGIVLDRELGFRSAVDSVTEQVLFVDGKDTVVVGELRKPGPKKVSFEGCPRFRIDLEPIFNPEVVWNASAERGAIHTSVDYRVDVFEGPRLIMSIRRGIPEISVTREGALEEARRLTGVRLDTRSCRFDPEEQLEKRGYAEVMQPVRRIAVADDGSVWVQRNARGGSEGPIDVFAADGSYLGSLDGETPFPIVFGPDGTFVARHEDDLGVEHLTLYEILRDGGD